MVKGLLKYLGSLRCSLHLIISLTGAFLIGFFLPQRALVGKEIYLKWQASSPVLARIDQSLQLTEVFTSPVTLALWVLFFLNLALVMKKRIPLILRKVAPDEGSAERFVAGPSTLQYRIELADGAEARIPAALARAGFTLRGSAGSFYAVKNRLSPLATLLFHLSFFLLLLGWLIVFYSRFSAFADVAEHEPFLGQLSRYNASPKLPKAGSLPEVKFLLESVLPEVSQGVATDIKITLRDEAGKQHLVGINRPYKTGYSSVLFNDLGVSPLFVIQDRSGAEIDGAYIKLNVLKGKRDSFKLHGYDFTALYYPDHFVADGVDRTRSEEFKNPAFHLEVSRDGRSIAAGTVGVGGTIEFDGYRVTFREQSFWVRLLVTKEYGREFIYAGFVLALIALVWRLVYYRRELTGTVRVSDGTASLHLSARADFYPALARDEFDRTVAALAGSLSGADNGAETAGVAAPSGEKR